MKCDHISPIFFLQLSPTCPLPNFITFFPFGDPLSPVSAAYICMDTGAFIGAWQSYKKQWFFFPFQASASGSPSKTWGLQIIHSVDAGIPSGFLVEDAKALWTHRNQGMSRRQHFTVLSSLQLLPSFYLLLKCKKKKIKSLGYRNILNITYWFL